MQTRHSVVWRIDIYAESPADAAKQAWEAMRNPDSIANYFEVFNADRAHTNVDLSEYCANEDVLIMKLADYHVPY